MPNTLQAGAARRIVNPPIGLKRPGVRLFADPVQAIESDLSATAVVFSNQQTKVAVIGLDMVVAPLRFTNEVRRRIGEAVGTPASHVLLNFSHTHSGGTLPDFITDSPENTRVKKAYEDQLVIGLVEAAAEASRNLKPARIAADFGQAKVGIYRREIGSKGQFVLGENPSVPVDHAVGVIRVDDLQGNVIATLFSHGCHPVTMGPRSMLASSDFCGAARDLIESALGGLSVFLQACGGNINPIDGIGYEVDCRDNKNRVGRVLGSEVIRVASNLRTHVKRSQQRKPMGVIPNILFWAWEPVDDNPPVTVAALEKTIGLEFQELPSLKEAEAIRADWQEKIEKARAADEREWVITFCQRYLDWADRLVDAVRKGNPPQDVIIQAIRIGEIVLSSVCVEAFTETGLAVKAASPFKHTEFLGYSNGCIAYLPLAKDYPAGGWKINERYAVPDMFFQAYNLPAAFRPDSEQKVVREALELIGQLKKES